MKPDTKQRMAANESWIAGLMERRVALGIAATASILLVALLVIQPGGQSVSQDSNEHAGMPASSEKPVSSKQPGDSGPRYRIPEKVAPRPVSKPKPAAPKVSAITPSTSTTPRQPITQTKIKPPVVTKQAVQDKEKPESRKVATTTTTKAVASQPDKKTGKPTSHIFFVQVGAYRDRGSAQQQASTLLQKGWNSMVTSNAAGLYVVRIGPVSSRKSADQLKLQLMNKAKLKGFIVEG